MVVHPWAWGILALVAIGLVVLDFLGHARNPHPPTAGEAARWTLFYVGLAGIFGVGIWLTNGWLYAQEFYAGWAMEWSLSVDNLFVFILILNAFRVPRENQQKALLFGIVIALLLRLVFILLGAALVARFSWVFFLFGLWLLWTAFSQIKETITGGRTMRSTRRMRSFVSCVASCPSRMVLSATVCCIAMVVIPT